MISKSIVKKIIMLSNFVDPKRKFSVVYDDPDDNKFIDVAIESKCDYIISQDKHLLNIVDFKGIKILKPNDFLKKI